MFSKTIKKVIHRYEGDLIAVNRLQNRCICAASMTAEPDSSCPHCLGTGFQVKVCEIKGVVQESNGPSTMRKVTDCVITKEIYIDETYLVNVKDLIVYNKEVFEIYQVKTYRLGFNEPVYHILYATPLKYDSHYVINNLNKVGALS